MIKRVDMILWFGGAIMAFFISSCNKSKEYKSDQNSFDLKGVINTQVNLLLVNNFGIHKVTGIDSKEEVVDLYPDSSGWVNELDIIKTADISKSGLRPYYRLKKTEDASYNIDSYILIDSSRSNILYQKIFRDKETNHLSKIMFEQQIGNPIYHSGRYMEIVFKDFHDNDVIIDSIKVIGYQKIIFLDTTFYNSICKIIPGL